MIVDHKGYKCDVAFGQYFNGNTAIQLVGSADTEYEGEAITTASVNGDVVLDDNVVGIKTWSENEGIVQSLVDGKVIEPKLLGFEPTGFVNIEYYKLTNKSLDCIRALKEEA